MRPMLASRGTSVPTGAGWIHEVKWDGMRVLAEIHGGLLRLWSRNENDVTVSFPELVDVDEVTHDVLFDGEVVAMAGGVPTFGALADRMHVGSAARARSLSRTNPVTFLVFDVLRLDGRDLTGEPLSVRRRALESLGIGPAGAGGEHWQVPPTYDDGPTLLSATEQQGLEGIVSKKLTSAYLPGRRTKEWLKFPNRPTGSYVAGGWRRETGSESRLGALLVGEPGPDGLRYRGRVGSGITGIRARSLLEMLDPLAGGRSPFCDQVPRVDALGTVWVRPEVVVEIAALGFTEGGRLRQPSFQGVRTDLTPADLGE